MDALNAIVACFALFVAPQIGIHAFDPLFSNTIRVICAVLCLVLLGLAALNLYFAVTP
ncbi:hypothetical protein Pam1_51 [Pseudanabaena phage Pam1]|jgi:hypothetical protein|nr:hypothetical protein Pam1_51 [Pseudanabaena phage Pam1]